MLALILFQEGTHSLYKIGLNGNGCRPTWPPPIAAHYRTHTGERPFQCKLCDRKFKDKKTCRKHIVRKSCLESFKKEKKIPTTFHNQDDEHILYLGWNQIEFEKIGPDYVCPHDGCDYKINFLPSIESHYRRHTGEKPFQCTLCNKLFNSKRHCKVHQDRGRQLGSCARKKKNIRQKQPKK